MNPALDRTARGFDRLSPHYDALVRLFPGAAIPRSQTLHLDQVRGCRRALLIGGGTGEFLVALLESGFRGHVVNLDVSAGMLHRSERRVRRVCPAARSRIDFRCGDVEALGPDERFDLVCTHFFLDLFAAPRLDAVVARLDAALEPGGVWLCSDFSEPSPGSGLRGAAQRFLLWALYTFFGWTCDVQPRRLPPIRAALEGRELHPLAVEPAAAGLLWSGCYRKTEGGAASAAAHPRSIIFEW